MTIPAKPIPEDILLALSNAIDSDKLTLVAANNILREKYGINMTGKTFRKRLHKWRANNGFEHVVRCAAFTVTEEAKKRKRIAVLERYYAREEERAAAKAEAAAKVKPHFDWFEDCPRAQHDKGRKP
jgi:hypothetical protein